MNDFGIMILITMLAVMTTIAITGACVEGIWQKRCIAHGAAHYEVQSNGSLVFKWNDQ